MKIFKKLDLKIWYIYLGLPLVAVTGMLFLFSMPTDRTEKLKHISENQMVVSIDLPENLTFAGEPVPFEDFDIRERMDRELLTNVYWHSSTILMLKRSYRWKDEIVKILREEGIPEDFYYLMLAESGLTHNSSGKGAKGFWQFIEETARLYGLTVNDNIDERLNHIKSTKAACKYFKDAYAKFNSWTLTAASYNMGMGGVTSALNRQMTGSYYDLYLNTETSRYIFRFLALKVIFEHPENYGFDIKDKEKYQPIKIRSVTVKESIPDIALYAQSVGTTYKYLKIMNPWLLEANLTLPPGKTVQLLIPLNTKGLSSEPFPIYQVPTDTSIVISENDSL